MLEEVCVCVGRVIEGTMLKREGAWGRGTNVEERAGLWKAVRRVFLGA